LPPFHEAGASTSSTRENREMMMMMMKKRNEKTVSLMKSNAMQPCFLLFNEAGKNRPAKIFFIKR
jgi:hypothetical protein